MGASVHRTIAAMTSPKVLMVCTGPARRTEIQGRTVLTAIHKQRVDGDVLLGPLGLQGDEQGDLTLHGGLAKAVYAYPSEHLPFWQTVRAQARAAGWDEPLEPGAFGVNLLLQGLREHELWIGDRLRLPQATLVVSEPRRPCFKFDHAMGFAQASKLMKESGFCGAYLAVLKPGTVRADQAFTLEPGPREVNLRELFKARVGR
jgi:MOSC domain-containing protein YiiM